MDRTWMREKLEAYMALLDRFGALPDHDRWRSPQGQALTSQLRRQEPTVKEILKRLDPQLAKFDFEVVAGHLEARSLVERGLGVLEDQEEWATRLAPDAPALPADRFHPWVWESARTLWSTQHYRQAVQAAATAITAHTQTKLGRRDLSDKKLMEAVFSTSPRPGMPRLLVNTNGLSEDTAKSLQAGVLSFAVGCFLAIRNPATHEYGDDWDEQTALECLAALSALARWIDAAQVDIP
jgi:uncharacterized protein (TIGR02391 family)